MSAKTPTKHMNSNGENAGTVDIHLSVPEDSLPEESLLVPSIYYQLNSPLTP